MRICLNRIPLPENNTISINQSIILHKIIVNGINEFNIVWNKENSTDQECVELESEISDYKKILPDGEGVFDNLQKSDSCVRILYEFDIHELSMVNFIVYDLHDELKRVIFKDELLNPDSYAVELFDGCWWLPRYNNCY